MSIDIHLDRVGHQFVQHQQHIRLFTDISLHIQASRRYAIVGASGSGKSTLLALLAAQETPTEGQLRFSRRSDNAALSTTELRRLCGFVFQQFHLLADFSALQNVALPLRLSGDPQALAKAADWLAKVGLSARAALPARLLSGGEQQRVALARALVGQPALVFADEPTGSLDERTAGLVADLLFECCQQSAAGLVVVTHNAELARRAEFCYQLAHGRCEPLIASNASRSQPHSLLRMPG